ncbi:MAG: hypothetical protein V2B13_12830 [Pseudomonadota bacterium]
MVWQKVYLVVTPEKAGVQTSSRRRPGTSSLILDSGFRQNDGKGQIMTFYRSIKNRLFNFYQGV